MDDLTARTHPDRTAPSTPRDHDAFVAEPARCPQCGRDVPVMEALVYHGLVYHPACVHGAGSPARPPDRSDG